MGHVIVPSLIVKVHEKGFRIPLDYEEVEFPTPEPIVKLIRLEIEKDELAYAARGKAEGKQIATIFIEYPAVEIVWYNIPRERWVQFWKVLEWKIKGEVPKRVEKRELSFEVAGEEYPAITFVEDFPRIRFPYLPPEAIIWIIENFKKFTDKVLWTLGAF